MAKYPLLYGNTQANQGFQFDFLDTNGVPQNSGTNGTFDIYYFKNSSNSLTQGYAIITIQNRASIGSNAPLSFSSIKLIDTNSNAESTTSLSGFNINHKSENGTIHIGPEEGVGNNTLNKTIAVNDGGTVHMGADSVASTAARWLKVPASGDISDTDDSKTNSPDIGTTTGSTRTIPIYTTDSIIANDIPDYSWATFIVSFIPEGASSGGSGIALQITGNTGTSTFPLSATTFNEAVITVRRGSVASGLFTAGATIADGGTLDLGYHGVTTAGGGLNIDDHVIEIIDSSPTATDFSWTSISQQVSSSNSHTTNNAVNANTLTGTHARDIAGACNSLGNYTTLGNLTTSGNFIFDAAGGAFSGTDTPTAIYTDWLPNTWKNGTAVIVSPSLADGGAGNYVEANFAVSQWNDIVWDATHYTPTTPYTSYCVKFGVYHRLTLPIAQWQAKTPYNESVAASSLTVGPRLTGQSGANNIFENGDTKEYLKINLRWNNWKGATNGVDYGTNTEFNTSSDSAFPLMGTNVGDTSVSAFKSSSGDEDVVTVTSTGDFAGFSFSDVNYKNAAFKYNVVPNLTFADHFNYSSGDATLQQDIHNVVNLYGVIRGTLTPKNEGVYWNPQGDNPHMQAALANYYRINFWPKQDVLTIYPRSLGADVFPTDIACPGYISGTGLVANDSGIIDVESVTTWYNATGAAVLANTSAAFSTNNSNITHADSTPVSNVYSGDGGKIYSNDSSAATNKTSGLAGFNSFVDVLVKESGATAYDSGRVFYNADKRFIRTTIGGKVPEFAPTNKIYNLSNGQLHPSSGDYIGHGVFKLGNPGNGLIWLHSIHTERAYMYEVDVSSSNNNNNSIANYGYMPNANSSTANNVTKLEFFTQAHTSTLEYNNWVTEKAYYLNNSGNLPSDSSASFIGTDKIGNYYLNIKGSSSAHCIIPNFGANNGSAVTESLYSNTVLNNNWGSPIASGSMEAESGGDIYVRMTVPSGGDVNDNGDYRMVMKVTYMVADYANQRYHQNLVTDDGTIVGAATLNHNNTTANISTSDKMTLRLKEATYIFKMNVSTAASLDVTDQENDAILNNAEINFGTINIG